MKIDLRFVRYLFTQHGGKQRGLELMANPVIRVLLEVWRRLSLFFSLVAEMPRTDGKVQEPKKLLKYLDPRRKRFALSSTTTTLV